MGLRQIAIDYDRQQDRLLVRISTDEGQEFRLWLTRLAVKRLWPQLTRMLEQDPALGSYGERETRRAVMGFQHEQAVSASDFSRPYDGSGLDMPLGSEPLLVARWTLAYTEDGQCRLELSPQQGQGVTLTLGRSVLHSLCWLLSTRANDAEWDFSLKLPTAASAIAPAPGKLN